jgi:hypothetical protein
MDGQMPYLEEKQVQIESNDNIDLAEGLRILLHVIQRIAAKAPLPLENRLLCFLFLLKLCPWKLVVSHVSPARSHSKVISLALSCINRLVKFP